jgi:hypothetical protein
MTDDKKRDSIGKIFFDFVFCMMVLPFTGGLIGTFLLNMLHFMGFIDAATLSLSAGHLIVALYMICIGLFLYRFLIKPML